jgi:hypothetical protein
MLHNRVVTLLLCLLHCFHLDLVNSFGPIFHPMQNIDCLFVVSWMPDVNLISLNLEELLPKMF